GDDETCGGEPIVSATSGIGVAGRGRWRSELRPDGSLDGRGDRDGSLCSRMPGDDTTRDTPERVSHSSAVPARVCCERTMPSSRLRIDRPELSDATTAASVVMPRICATATPRPARHLLSSYSRPSIDCGRSVGLRAIADITRSLTGCGSSPRTRIGGGGSCVAFLVRISMKLSPEYGGWPVHISYMIAPS